MGLVSADAAGRFAPGDGNAMGTYIERYVYDAVGNFLQMQHRGSDPIHPGWTRAYDYLESSLIEYGNVGAPLKTSNRLTRTTLNPAGSAPQPEPYLHDAHGNMVSMPHLTRMDWDYKDRLSVTSRQVVNDTLPPDKVPETTYYVYDAGGQRVRKVTERQNGKRKCERIYLGGFEIYREFKGNGDDIDLERETLHVMDDKQRIALVETRTLGNDPAPQQLIRYQFGNHLGSASLELDQQAQIISYEEYAPYGSSTYQAVHSQTETAKRYRFTGRERDEESGFYYHGARYYAAWVGRWTSADPMALIDGANIYVYTRANPTKYIDPAGTQCDPNIATCPELMSNWSYGTPVPDRGSVGHNVQRDHPIQVTLRNEQRGGNYTRSVSATRGEQTVLVETGRGYFHTEVGRLQAEINDRVRAGVITTESELIEATREAYRLAGEATGVAVNEQALDRAIVSNLATLSETAAQTSAELSRMSGATTVTEESFNLAFRDPSPSPTPVSTPATVGAPAAPTTTGAAAPELVAPTPEPGPPVNPETGVVEGGNFLKTAPSAEKGAWKRLAPSAKASMKSAAMFVSEAVIKIVTTEIAVNIALPSDLEPSDMDKDAARNTLGAVPPGADIVVAGVTRFVFETVERPIVEEFYKQYQSPMAFFQRVYGGF